MAGAQDEMVTRAGRAFWHAKEELETAKRAPNSSASQRALKEAQRRYNEADGRFTDAYGDYYTSMMRSQNEPRPASYFIKR